MDVREFWKLIELVDPSAIGNENHKAAIQTLISTLAGMDSEELQSFQEHLVQKLWDLDGPQYADATGYIGGTDDTFLHVRCFVVSMGRDYYERALQNPSRMPTEYGSWYEPILFATSYAWEKKTGEKRHFIAKLSFETCSNMALWRTRKSQSGWIKVCFDAPCAQASAESGLSKPPATSEIVKACFTYMVEDGEPSVIDLGPIGVLHAQALDKTVLLAVLPLRSALPLEPGYLLLSNGAPIELTYRHFRSGEPWDFMMCYAAAELSQRQLEKIKAAKEATMSFGNEYMGGSISTPLDCCRFAEAFDGEPVPASAQNEMQRGVIALLLRKFHDFIE